MSLSRPSWLMPALTIAVTMAVFGGVMLYLNPDRASALDETAPAGGSLVVAADDTNTCASICRSGSNVCISASACQGGSCTVEECLEACKELGVTCSQECVDACTGECTGGGQCTGVCTGGDGECSGDCTGDGQCAGICTGDGNGACKTSSSTSCGGSCRLR